ncbi:MAG: hypothetical protein IPQ14_04085 [Candidatus Microthrix sp.]|nr:hypothetical protein [Candidatus Microthrix sp.]
MTAPPPVDAPPRCSASPQSRPSHGDEAHSCALKRDGTLRCWGQRRRSAR